MLFGNGKYVMQFKDGTFLKRGFFHAFVFNKDGIEIGRTKELKEAVFVSDEAEAFRIAYDLELEERFILREVEIIFKLK